MKLPQKYSGMLLLAFMTAYGNLALAAPASPSIPGDAKVAQAQTGTPVDCKKTPTDPSCKNKK